MALLFPSCQKDGLPVPPDQAVDEPATTQAPNPGLLELRSEEEPAPTILGDSRVNPYTVTVMTQAWNNLYGDDYAYESLPPTHLYVKISPQDIEQLAALQESELVLLDFPMDHEVVEMGDYYPQPWKTEEEIPDYFGVVATEEEIPIENYEVLEELIIPPYDSYLTAEAFRLTGNAYYPDGVDSGEGDPPAPESGCNPDCTYYPDCLMGYPCEDEDPGGSPPGGEEPEPPCTPENPLWPDCLMEPGDPDPVSGSEFIVNDCGCRVFANPRKPGGCIEVEDVQLNDFFGVRQVQVNWWDGWFAMKKTQTDDNGCWRIDHIEAGKAYMWVKFKGPLASFRGFVGNTVQIWNLLLTVVDFAGQIGGGTYNNISINYSRWVNQGSAAHRYWSAASANNAFHEFAGMAAADGLNLPPFPLDVFLASNRTDGSALMKKELGRVRVGTAVAAGLWQNSVWAAVAAFHAGATSASILGFEGLPDIILGCDFMESDNFRSLVYHELAHASHITNAGPDFWKDLVIAEIAARGWGDANGDDAGLIAICESWAAYVGDSYTHRRYGTMVSLLPGRTWETELEQTRNDLPDHVPIGVHLDLIDPAVGLEPFLACEDSAPSCGPIIDNVTGFTNAQLFSILDENTGSPEAYRTRIINELSGNPAQINDLFNSY